MTETSTVTRLSVLDRMLPVWIAVAMAAGLLLGRWVPSFDDPANQPLDTVRAIRDDIAERVRALIAELAPTLS